MFEKPRPRIYRCLECPVVSETLEEARDHAIDEKHWVWGVMYAKEAS